MGVLLRRTTCLCQKHEVSKSIQVVESSPLANIGYF